MAESVQLPNLQRRCPECGTPSRFKRVSPPKGLLHKRRSIPVLFAFVALISLVALFAWGAARVPAWVGPTYFSDRSTLLLPVISVKDLRTVAAQEPGARGDLIAAVLAYETKWLVRPPGRHHVFARLSEHSGTQYQTTVYGLPAPCFWITSSSEYRDALTPDSSNDPRAQALARARATYLSAPRQTFSFDGGTVFYEPGDLSYTRYALYLPGVAVTLSICVATWYCAGLVAGILCSRGRRGGLKYRRRIQWIAMSISLIGLIAVSVFRPEETLRISPQFSMSSKRFASSQSAINWYPLFSPIAIKLDMDAIAALKGTPDGAHKVARAFLEVLGDGPDEALLAIQVEPDSIRTEEFFALYGPMDLFSLSRIRRWMSEPESRSRTLAPLSGFGGMSAVEGLPTVMWPPGGSLLRVQQGWIQYVFSRSSQSDHLDYFQVNWVTLVTCVFLVWASWAGARACGYGIAWFHARRRVARVECVNCGYSLR